MNFGELSDGRQSGPGTQTLGKTQRSLHSQRSADSFAANLWELQRKPPELTRASSFPLSPTSRSSDDTTKRAASPAPLFRGTARSVQTRGPAGQVPPRTVLYCSDPMPSCHMPDAVHAHAEYAVTSCQLVGFDSAFRGLEGRKGARQPAQPTCNATRTVACCSLQAHGACCLL